MSRGTNESVWQDAAIAAGYARAEQLQPAEQRIRDELRPQMAAWSMLDIGVGGGRTTEHFAGLVREYVGIDYSESMIAACRRRFAGRFQAARFEVLDSRAMSSLGDRSFDFVLFSFNGIDYVSHDERMQVFAEVRRVGRPGGWFCFSTHNLRAAGRLMRLRGELDAHPVRLVRNLQNWLRWQVVHSREVKRRLAAASDYALINDGAQECQLETYYVLAEEQLRQLDAGFRDVRVFSGVSGSELSAAAMATDTAEWLYFLGRFR